MEWKIGPRIILIGLALLFLLTNASAVTIIHSTQDINYSLDDDKTKMDFYEADQFCHCTGIKPAIIYFHGLTPAVTETFQPVNVLTDEPFITFLTAGYNLFIVDYNEPVYPGPGGKSFLTKHKISEDATEAVQYLRQNDTNYSISRNNIIAFGTSTGSSVWTYGVWGPDMNVVGASDQRQFSSRPNYAVLQSGQLDWNGFDNNYGGYWFNVSTIGQASTTDKNAASAPFMIDTNWGNPAIHVPTFLIYSGTASVPPISNPHDKYFGERTINTLQAHGDVISTLYGTGMDASAPNTILTWLRNQNGYNLTSGLLSYTDTFADYANNIKIINDFNTITGWNPTNDGNPPIFSSSCKITSSCLQFPVDVSKAGGNAATWDLNMDQNLTLDDENADSWRLYLLFKTDENTLNTSYAVKLGQLSSQNWNYATGPSGPPTGNTYLGWNLLVFDFNTPFSKSGNPILTDVNYIQFQINYSGGQGDFNVWIDQVWLEAPPNPYNNIWNTVQDTNFIYGWSTPFNTPAFGTGLTVIDTNFAPAQGRGIVLSHIVDYLDTSGYDFNISVDMNQVDTTESKILFNYIDASNYSSCFVQDLNNTGRAIGIEQVTNGSAIRVSSTTNFGFNTSQKIQCDSNGGIVNVRLNGTIMKTATGFSHIDYPFGLESDFGRTKYKNYAITMSALSSSSSSSGSFGTPPNAVFTLARDYFLPIILLLFMLAIILGGFVTGDIQMALLGIIMIFIIYTLITGLFFH